MWVVESLKFCTFSFSYKITEELCLMTLKNDAKFKVKLTCSFKHDIGNLVSFHPTTQKSENLHFHVPLLSIKFQLKKYRKVISRDTKEWSNLWRRIDFVWKMTWGIWWILTQSVKSVKICTLIGCFCRKYVMFELKNTDEVCHEKWLMVSKIT